MNSHPLPSLSSLLATAEDNLDRIVALVNAAAAAYKNTAEDIAPFLDLPPAGIAPFEHGNTQGYWTIADGSAALLAFRGSANLGHWLSNFRIQPPTGVNHPWGTAHPGFYAGFQDALPMIEAFAATTKHVPHVWLTGHSLGGVLAVFAAAWLHHEHGRSVHVCTFGQPMPGFEDFTGKFEAALSGRVLRIINQKDIVPRVPGAGYRHCGRVKRIVRKGGLDEGTRGQTHMEWPELEDIGNSDAIQPCSEEQFDFFIRQLEALEHTYGPTAPAYPLEEGMVIGTLPWTRHHFIQEYQKELTRIRSGSLLVPGQDL